MVNGLSDCLKEANLAQYTKNFLQLGVGSLDALSDLTIQEYAQFGITDLVDKKRLFRLIHIVKSVQSDKSKNEEPQGQGGSISRRKGNRSLEDLSVKANQGTSPPNQRNSQPSSLNNSGNVSERSPRTNMNKSQQEGFISQRNSSHKKKSEDNLLSIARKELKKGTLSPGTLRKLETQGGILFVKATTSTSPKLSRQKPSAKKKLHLRESLSDSEVADSDYTDASVPIGVSSFGAPQILKRSFIEVIDHLDGSVYNYGIPDQEQRSSTRHEGYQGIQGASDAGERIKVCIRKRPLNKKEERENEVDVVQTEGRGTVVMNEAKVAVDLTKFMQVHKYHFDEVFGESCKNEEVYARTAKPLISTMFNRGKATCFAYGQTGAGKTHTMLGNSGVKGLYLLAAQDIFATLNASRKSGNELAVWASYFEIYCGQLFDLLNDRQRVHAREDSQHRVCIAGIREVQVSGTQSLMQVVEQGNKLRSKGVSGVNADSSRSHAILQLQLQDGGRRKLGRFSFIDLAGSERACDTVDPDKVTRYEGAEINTSLLALKECIRALDQEQRHTPFRQSKLTQVLRDSFLGHSRTCMIANIAPNDSAVDHTLNTLRYADRVKELKKETSSYKPVSVSPYPSTPNTFSPGTTSTPLKTPNSKQMQPSLKTQVTTPGPRPTKGAATPTSASSQTPGSNTAKKVMLVRKVSTEKASSKSLNQSSSLKTSRRPDDNKQSNISTENYQNKRNRENSTGKSTSELSDTKVQYKESVRRPSLNVKKNLNVTFDRNVKSGETPSKRDEEVKAQTKEAFLQGSPLPVWYPPEGADKPPKVPSTNPGDTWDIENPHYIYSPMVQRAVPSASSPPPRDAKEKKLTPELPSRNKTPNSIVRGEKEDLMSEGHTDQPLPDQESGFLADDELTDNWANRNSSSAMKHSMRTQYSDTSCSTDTESTIELLAEIDYALRNSLVSPISDNGISDNQPVMKEYPTLRTSQVGVSETPKRTPRNRTKSAPQPKLFPECQPVTSGSTSPPHSSVLVHSQYVMSLHPEIRINDSPDSMSTDSLQELEAERHLSINRQIPNTRLGNSIPKTDQLRSPLYRKAPLPSQGAGSPLKSKLTVKGKESVPSPRDVSVSSEGQSKSQSVNYPSKRKEHAENPSGVIVSTSFHDYVASTKPHESIQSGQPMVQLSKSDCIRPSPIGKNLNSAAINPIAKNSKGSIMKNSTGLQSPITVEILRSEERSSAFSPISGNPRYSLPSSASNLASTPNKAFMKESLIVSQQSPISKEKIVYQQHQEAAQSGQRNQCNEGEGMGSGKGSSSPEALVPKLQLAGVTGKNDTLLSPRHARQNSAIERAKELLVSAHAEQIGELERLCEREWRLIKQLHSGEKGLSEYLQYAKDLMNSKLRCIDTFNDQLSTFSRCSTPDLSPRSRSPMEAC